jgi:hypothetical protein
MDRIAVQAPPVVVSGDEHRSTGTSQRRQELRVLKRFRQQHLTDLKPWHTATERQTDRRTDRALLSYMYPENDVLGGGDRSTEVEAAHGRERTRAPVHEIAVSRITVTCSPSDPSITCVFYPLSLLYSILLPIPSHPWPTTPTAPTSHSPRLSLDHHGNGTT